jgi:hypothetical protein
MNLKEGSPGSKFEGIWAKEEELKKRNGYKEIP